MLHYYLNLFHVLKSEILLLKLFTFHEFKDLLLFNNRNIFLRCCQNIYYSHRLIIFEYFFLIITLWMSMFKHFINKIISRWDLPAPISNQIFLLQSQPFYYPARNASISWIIQTIPAPLLLGNNFSKYKRGSFKMIPMWCISC